MSSKKNINMSYEERKEYRLRKKKIRKIQVYSELALIALSIVVCATLVITHVHKDKKDSLVVADEPVTAENSSDTGEGLKVSSGASQEEASTAEIADEEVPMAGGYSASETDKTVFL